MKKLVTSALASKYEAAAAQAMMAESRRYCLDVARELYFLGVRDELYRRDAAGDYPALARATSKPRLQTGPLEGLYTPGDTLAYWKLAQEIEAFVNDYGAGDFDRAALDLGNIPPPDHPITGKE